MPNVTHLQKHKKCGSSFQFQLQSHRLHLSGYAKRRPDQKAMSCFQQFKCSYISLHLESLWHHRSCRQERSSCDTLVDINAQCDLLAKVEVCDKHPIRDVVLCKTHIAQYAEHKLGKEALNCFEHLQLEGMSAYAVTFVCSLKTCGSGEAIEKGIAIHAKMTKKGLLVRSGRVCQVWLACRSVGSVLTNFQFEIHSCGLQCSME